MDDSAMLIVKEGPELGRRWQLQAEVTLLGRAKDADITIDDRRISSRHAQVVHRDGQHILQDLGSKNGTYLNGERLQGQRALADGDEICLAMVVVITYVAAGRTMPLMFREGLQRGVRLDVHTRRVLVDGAELDPPLSQAQFRLLQMLIEADGAVCTRDRIMATVWPEEDEEGITEQAIDALVRRLRDRLAELDPDHTYVATVRGHGFRLEQKPGG